MPWRIGIDIGGTFTDLVASELESGALHLRKVPSTLDNLAAGAAGGLNRLADALSIRDVSFFGHGTTAGTNALIEGTGARTALLTTKGFRDLLEIARQRRPALYDLRARKAQPLVPRWLRREIGERMGSDGAVITALDGNEVKAELALLAGERVEALAICLLHSYANAAHERLVRNWAEQVLPDAYVTASSDLLPRFREYERLSTTVVNAYLGPLMNRYLDELSRRIAEAGVACPPHIMQSNGGLVPLDEARRKPASTVLSGPAAGAAAAADVCRQLDLDRAIAIDMGGTSTDVCLIEGGLPASAPGREVGGYAVELPGVDVHCIGAGGGSMLSVDPAGLPRLGPRSAGADPGPACYGRGGQEPTLTDAFLLLGRIAPAGLLGGAMSLDPEAARGAMASKVGEALGLGPEGAALGAVALAVANVRRAVEAMTMARGRDPREFVLVAAGGAGPLIACELAAELGINEVIVPTAPGNFSAFGLVASDLRRDWVRTRIMLACGERLPELAAEFRALEDKAQQWLTESLEPTARVTLLRRIAARYQGQDYELDVEVPSGQLSPVTLGQVIEAFHEAHQARYGYHLQTQPVEFVDVMVSAVGAVTRPHTAVPADGKQGGAAQTGARPVLADGQEQVEEWPVLDRARLSGGDGVAGPTIIEQYDSTIYLPRGCIARVVDGGCLRVATGGSRG